jgi:DNA-binding transcriptional regulator YdaS (Cro superfamily)
VQALSKGKILQSNLRKETLFKSQEGLFVQFFAPTINMASSYTLTEDDIRGQQTELARRLGIPQSSMCKKWKDATGGAPWPSQNISSAEDGLTETLTGLKCGAVDPVTLGKLRDLLQTRNKALGHCVTIVVNK